MFSELLFIKTFFLPPCIFLPQVMILMTDGQQSWSPDQVPLPEAIKPFIRDGTLRYAVGIGPEISPVELAVIAGKNVVLADDFESLLDELEDQIGLIGTDGCKGSVYSYLLNSLGKYLLNK